MCGIFGIVLNKTKNINIYNFIIMSRYIIDKKIVILTNDFLTIVLDDENYYLIDILIHNIAQMGMTEENRQKFSKLYNKIRQHDKLFNSIVRIFKFIYLYI